MLSSPLPLSVFSELLLAIQVCVLLQVRQHQMALTVLHNELTGGGWDTITLQDSHMARVTKMLTCSHACNQGMVHFSFGIHNQIMLLSGT